MKKTLLLLSVVSLLAMAGCKKYVPDVPYSSSPESEEEDDTEGTTDDTEEDPKSYMLL